MYHIKGLDFLVVVDYVKDQISLVVHGFAKDKGRVASRALNSTKGVVGKIISTLTVLDMDFKIANDVLTVLDMRIMVGYRSGQLVAMTCRNN